MSSQSDFQRVPGPFRARDLKSGDPYELSNGHPVLCLPTGGRGSRAHLSGGPVLSSDPEVESAGVDTGFAPEPGTLRAPDIAIGNVSDQPGWVPGAPLLAVEYADVDQDEDSLQSKIQDLLHAGTRLIWVVRLVGPRRVEVYRPDGPRTIVSGDDSRLEAPGILRNPVPLAALFDRDAAHAHTLRNLLQRQGYDSLDDLRSEGQREGRAQGQLEGHAQGQREGRAQGQLEGQAQALLEVLTARGFTVDDTTRATILACRDSATLTRWLTQAAVSPSLQAVFR